MRKGGFEPPRSCERQPLKLVRLPVPPLPQVGPAEAGRYNDVRLKPDTTYERPADAGHSVREVTSAAPAAAVAARAAAAPVVVAAAPAAAAVAAVPAAWRVSPAPLERRCRRPPSRARAGP